MSAPTSDDLRERIQEGDLDALLDPAFELHLLADGPTADWWETGAHNAVLKLIELLAQRIDPHRSASILSTWRPRKFDRAPDALHYHKSLERIRGGKMTPEELGSLVGRTAYFLTAHDDEWANTCALVDLARSLRGELPSAPPEVDAALDALERYAS